MARKLLNVCVVFALLAGCRGGVLAAAICPHADCETTAAPAEVPSTQDEHTGGHCHGATISEAGSSPAKAHEGHVAERSAPAEPQFGRVELTGAGAPPGGQFCAHCVGSPQTPPSPFDKQQFNSPKKNRDFAAPTFALQVGLPPVVSLRKIKPAQNAPPGRADRHLLLNVFRI